jgi:hypothetical protein
VLPEFAFDAGHGIAPALAHGTRQGPGVSSEASAGVRVWYGQRGRRLDDFIVAAAATD